MRVRVLLFFFLILVLELQSNLHDVAVKMIKSVDFFPSWFLRDV